MSTLLAFLRPAPLAHWALPYVLWAAAVIGTLWWLTTRPTGTPRRAGGWLLLACLGGALPQVVAHTLTVRTLQSLVRTPQMQFVLAPARTAGTDTPTPRIEARTAPLPAPATFSLTARDLEAPWLRTVAPTVLARLQSGGGQWLRTVSNPRSAARAAAAPLPAVSAFDVVTLASGGTLLMYGMTLAVAGLLFGAAALGGAEAVARLGRTSPRVTRSLRTAMITGAVAATTATLGAVFEQDARQYATTLALLQRPDVVVAVDTLDARTALTVSVGTPERPPRIDTLRFGAATYIDTLRADTTTYLTVRQLRALVRRVPFATGTPHLDTLRAALFAAEGDTGPGPQ